MKTCTSGHTNADAAKYCSECGQALPLTARARPGAAIVPPPPPSEGAGVKKRPFFKRPVSLAVGVEVGLGIVGIISALAGPQKPKTQAQGFPVVATSAASPFSSAPSYSPSSTPRAVRVKIPNVVGLTVKEARGKFHEAANAADGHASVHVEVAYKYSTQPKGTILSSGPAAGVRLDSPATVRLTLAKPIPRVPSVLGMSGDKAKRELRKFGYSVRTREQETSSASKGTVLAQSVPAGSEKIPDRTTIVLALAKPPQGWFVRVEGAGAAMVTWGNIHGTSQQTVSLPWTAEVKKSGMFDSVTVLAQRQSGDSGSIVCEIIHNGQLVKKTVASGPYAVCDASN